MYPKKFGGINSLNVHVQVVSAGSRLRGPVAYLLTAGPLRRGFATCDEGAR